MHRSRHIAVVTSSFPAADGDASGHFVVAEVLELLARGHRVTVLAPAGADLSESCHPNLTLRRIPSGTAFGWPGLLARLEERPTRFAAVAAFCVRARAELRRVAPDEVVTHWLVPGLWPISSGFRGPNEVVAHGSDVELVTRLPRPLFRRLVASALRGDVRLRFVSDRLRDEFLLACGPLLSPNVAARSFTKPCAINTHGTPPRSLARTQLGLNDEFLAVCVGRLVPGKHVDWALEHAPVPSGARWVIIGDGPDLGSLRTRYPEATFLGRLNRNDALVWLSAADVLVHCSRREGAPTVIREARALGTAVWSNDVGDVRAWAAEDPGIRILDELRLDA